MSLKMALIPDSYSTHTRGHIEQWPFFDLTVHANIVSVVPVKCSSLRSALGLTPTHLPHPLTTPLPGTNSRYTSPAVVTRRAHMSGLTAQSRMTTHLDVVASSSISSHSPTPPSIQDLITSLYPTGEPASPLALTTGRAQKWTFFSAECNETGNCEQGAWSAWCTTGMHFMDRGKQHIPAGIYTGLTPRSRNF